MSSLDHLGMVFLRVAVWVGVAVLDGLLMPSNSWAAEDYSHAETQLFMQAHFDQRPMPQVLRYQFTKTSGLEPGFQDQVTMQVSTAQTPCCQTQVAFLSGERRMPLPDVQAARGNPVILHVLERDIREMQRLTQGQATYFRKRIRQALYQGAQEQTLQIRYKGQSVAAQSFEIAPYQDDPLRARLGAWADKRYVFILSKAVPGTLVAIRSWLPSSATPDKPWQETLLLEGVAL